MKQRFTDNFKSKDFQMASIYAKLQNTCSVIPPLKRIFFKEITVKAVLVRVQQN
jgi:hypothetical protein